MGRQEEEVSADHRGMSGRPPRSEALTHGDYIRWYKIERAKQLELS
jgi:hypothetical protein